MGDVLGLAGVGKIGEGLGHSMEAERVKRIQRVDLESEFATAVR
jgi:hypothetical protein